MSIWPSILSHTALISLFRCDRILFKTTVPIPPTPIQEEPPQELPRVPTPHRRVTPMLENLMHAFRPKSHSGSAPSSATLSVTSAAADSRKQSKGGVSSKKSSNGSQANGGGPMSMVVTSPAQGETDSPVALSLDKPDTLPVPESNKDGISGQAARRTTSPNAIVIRTGSGGASSTTTNNSMRPNNTKRRRSLSATLPRTSEPVELMGRTIPASASMPPIFPSDNNGNGHDHDPAPGKTTGAETGSVPFKSDAVPNSSGGGARAIRRILSFLPGSFGNLQNSPAMVTPGTGQSIIIDSGPPPRVWKRGEVQCLEYATLSDREMRRLEGRSDHRPVIGQFAVYL